MGPVDGIQPGAGSGALGSGVANSAGSSEGSDSGGHHPAVEALPSKKGTWFQALSSFFFSILLIMAFRWAFFEPYVIPSGSMLPTLLIHDHILVNKFAYGVRFPFTKTWIVRFAPPQRGEIVVFNSVEERGVFLVKRVIGLPGDRIEIAENGDLVVNGHPQVRDPVTGDAQARVLADWRSEKSTEFADGHGLFRENLEGRLHSVALVRDKQRYGEGPFVVPEGHLFMMGDNRDNSSDSRVWGALPMENVLGHASIVWLSCEDTLKQAAQICDPRTIRFSRLFRSLE